MFVNPRGFVKLFFQKSSVALIPFFILCFSAPLSAQPTNSQGDLGTVIQDFAKLSDGQKETILTAAGLPQPSDLNLAKVAAYFIFGSIGFIAFFYGRKEASWRPTVIGMVLMVYPYAVSNTYLLYAIGIVLTAGLYFFRE